MHIAFPSYQHPPSIQTSLHKQHDIMTTSRNRCKIDGQKPWTCWFVGDCYTHLALRVESSKNHMNQQHVALLSCPGSLRLAVCLLVGHYLTSICWRLAGSWVAVALVICPFIRCLLVVYWLFVAFCWLFVSGYIPFLCWVLVVFHTSGNLLSLVGHYWWLSCTTNQKISWLYQQLYSYCDQQLAIFDNWLIICCLFVC